jgi:hypothetical protein
MRINNNDAAFSVWTVPSDSTDDLRASMRLMSSKVYKKTVRSLEAGITSEPPGLSRRPENSEAADSSPKSGGEPCDY